MSARTFVELLQARASSLADQEAFTFLVDGEINRTVSYGELDARARDVGAALSVETKPGDRALLLFAPAFEYVEAFFGCLYAGIIPVPAYPPDVSRLARSVPRLATMAADAGATRVLTTSGIRDMAHAVLTEMAPALAELTWISTDEIPQGHGSGWQPVRTDDSAVAFLQYTSGSTGAPKGVRVTHRNLIHNSGLIHQGFGHTRESRGVIWLPPYHDMGLIGGVLQPIFGGFPAVLMSPLDFLVRPQRWVEAISRFHATTSGGPNFAYDLCARKTTEEQCAALDLSAWSIAFSGAEPVREKTLSRFVEKFGRSGFRRSAFYPCYGLAEATLIVTGASKTDRPRCLSLDPQALEKDRAEACSRADATVIASCGPALGEQQLLIVDPATLQPSAAGTVGEVWVSGPSVADGYWEKPELSAEVFQASPVGSGALKYLRTGDLGFLEAGELFVTGRLKDLIIIRGRNYYPADLEATSEQSHPALRKGCGVAFPVEVDGEEKLVLVQELDLRQASDPEEVLRAIRDNVSREHELQVHDVILIQPGSLPKTSSGKVQRRACREEFLQGKLEVLAKTAGAQGKAPSRGDSRGPVGAASSLSQAVAALLAEKTGTPLEQIRVDRPVTELGLDSLTAVELQSELETRFGLSIPMHAFLAGQSIEQLLRSAVTLVRAGVEYPVSADEGHALTPGQEGVWLLQRLAQDSAVYSVGCVAKIHGEVDDRALGAALVALVNRHAALRTTFVQVHNRPRAQVAARLNPQLIIETVEGTQREVEEHVARKLRVPFQVEQGSSSLVRAHLVHRRGSASALLGLVVHHLVTDFWSMATLARELGELYEAERRGKPALLPALDRSYAEHARALESSASADQAERDWAFWKPMLENCPPLGVSTDRPRRALRSFGVHRVSLRIDEAVTQGLKKLARESSTTLFVTVLAAYQAFLHRWSGQEAVIVGSPVSGRGAGFAGTLGFFAQLLPFRADVAPGQNFVDVLAQTKQRALGAFAHQGLPYGRMIQRLGLSGSAGAALVQASFAWQQLPRGADPQLLPFALGELGAQLAFGSLTLERVQTNLNLSEYEVSLELGEHSGGLIGSLQLNAELFDEQTLNRIARHLGTFLEGLVEAPRARISTVPLFGAAERESLLHEWNQTQVPFPDACVHQLFERQAAVRPQAPAISFGDVALSYRQLNRRANQLARQLRAQGVKSEDLVAFAMPRSADAIVCMLAILKAGGAYLPVDPNHAQERLDVMLETSGAKLLVVHPALEERFTAASVHKLLLPAVWNETTALEDENLNLASHPLNLAYALFTSGSTGRPKAIPVTHQGIVRLVVNTNYVQLTSADCVAQVNNHSFDAVTFEVWGALLNGARLVGVSREDGLSAEAFGREIQRHGINTVLFTTAVFNKLIRENPSLFRGIKHVLFGGEACDPSTIRTVLKEGPPEHLINAYGPTEATAIAATHEIRSVADGAQSLPIGYPIANTQLYILDQQLEPVAVGLTGELYVGGPGLARGYLGRGDLTAASFIPNPFGPEPGARLYRTGDFVRRLADGSVVFLERRDGQIKLAGFRIELGEIQARLLELPGVGEAAVVVRDEAADVKRLVAYVVAKPGQTLVASMLRDRLAAQLPAYMVPVGIGVLPALPMTANGKLDRKALPPVEVAAAADSYVAPRTPVEQRLAASWATLLHLGRVGIHDNFFALGGHSLLATQAHVELREAFGVELPLRSFFETPTIAELAIQVLEAVPSKQGRVFEPVSRASPLPLSFAQERLWFLDRLEPDSPFYVIAGALELNGSLDAAALEASLREVVLRHEALRTTFHEVDGQPVQRVESKFSFELQRVDLSSLEAAEREVELKRQAQAEALRPFSLHQAPLLRAKLVKLSAQRQVLLISMHHIASDGWSVGVLAHEVGELYEARKEGRPSRLLPLAVQYVDFTAWQRASLQGEPLEGLLKYWRAQLQGMSPVLELPTDRPRPAVQRFRGAQARVQIGAELTRALETLGQEEGATLFMTVLAAYQAVLGRYAQQTDVAVGTPIANRTRAEVAPMIGFFVNTLVMRGDLSGRPSFRELLRRTREVALGAFAHQDLPFEKLVEDLRPERSLSRSALFQVMFVLQPPQEALRLKGLELSLLEQDFGTAKFDLTLTLGKAGGGLSGTLEYATDLFDAQTAQRLVGHLQMLLQGVVSRPDVPLDGLELMPPAEWQRVVHEWNQTQVPFPDACVHQLFERQAAVRPQAPAISFGDVALSYRQLNRRANQLARQLRAQGVKSEDLVAFAMPRSADAIVCMLAILKAGGAYLPVDPNHAQERLDVMLETSGAKLLVVHPALEERFTAASVHKLLLPAVWNETTALEDENLNLASHPLNLAYALFTSGSTGRPKAIPVTHQGIVRLVVNTNYVQLTSADCVAQVNNHSFDAVTFEVWGALLNGARLVGVSREDGLSAEAFGREIQRHGINTVLFTTAVFNKLIRENPSLFRGIKHVLFGGEACDPSTIRTVLKEGPPEHLINAYGPTEATAIAATHEIRSVADGAQSLPIGYPIANTQLYILDQQLEPVAVGLTGELYVGGPGLARGYLGRGDLTAASFIPNPFGPEPGARLYRTGDFVRRLADGSVVFLERRDGQIKLAGFRIELGEIQARLLELPGVGEAAVVVRDEAADVKRLVAYVVAKPGQTLVASMLRDRLAAQLPAYMVPVGIGVLPALPMTANGKLDRKALPPVEVAAAADSYVAPRTPVEQRLAASWATLLHLGRVGIHDNFFALGGHSLLATRAVASVQQSFGVELPLRTFFETPTIAALAARVEQLKQTSSLDDGPKLRAAGVDVELNRVDDLSAEELDALLAELEKETEPRS